MTYTLESFLTARRKEKEWMHVNGYENENPTINGEFYSLSLFLPRASLFIDVGANNGLYIDRALSLKPGCHIVAYEANPRLCENLLERYKESTVKVCNVALNDRAGEVEFYCHPTDDTASSLLPRTGMMPNFADKMIPEKMLAEKLDDRKFGDHNSIFIKIDVEGAELPVMKGARETLASSENVAVLFEYSFGWKEHGHTLKDCCHYLDRLGFQLYRITPLGLEHVRFYTLRMDDFRYCNYLAVKGFDLDRLSAPVAIETWEASSRFHPF